MFQKAYKAWRKVIEVSLWFWLASIFLFLGSCGSCAKIFSEQSYVFNFKVRQIEAKTLLRDLYVNQKKIYDETSRYSGCIDELTNSETKRKNYIVGFGEKTQQIFGCSSVTEFTEKEAFVNQDLINAFEKSYVDINAYLAVAVGRICDDCDLDIWSIDQDKNLINVQTGLPRHGNATVYLFFVLISYFFLVLISRFLYVKKQKFKPPHA